MELPKNITQIGESDKYCKIYVEDYVVSYIKQINKLSCNKDMAVALYGRRRTENEVSYLFLYGACKLDFLQRETRHLSQAQLQEIEKLRKKYFADYEFLGYRLLNGEMVEGIHVYEQGICRYTAGYAQFYEKNDAMLAYMLSARELDKEPEAVDREKYETVKKRQEERRVEYRSDRTSQGVAGKKTSPLTKMRVASAAVFLLVGLAAVSFMWDEQNTEALKTVIGQAMAEFAEQKLPDATPETEEISVPTTESASEATTVQETTDVPAPTIVPEVTPAPVPTTDSAPTALQPSTDTSAELPASTDTPAPSDIPATSSVPEPTPVPAMAPVSYTVLRGDTLIRISISNYGDDSMVQEICDLNGITNPDDIKVGDKILLP